MVKNTKRLIEKTIKDAGNLLLRLKKDKKNMAYQTHNGQIKAYLDNVIHKYLTVKLEKIMAIPIISEEDSVRVPGMMVPSINECFIIDPIDGTASLINGFKGYVVQIAYIQKGIPIYSCVYAPEYDNLYTATMGKGAYLNGNPLKKNDNSSIVIIDNYPTPSDKIKEIMSKLPKAKYLESGSIGLKICRVAEGLANIFFKNVVIKDWDIIPGILILKEMGGFTRTLDTHDCIYFQHDDFSQNGLIATSDKDLMKYAF